MHVGRLYWLRPNETPQFIWEQRFAIGLSDKGCSAHQMHRMIGISYKSTWFMMHRVREAMNQGTFPGGLGGKNKVVGLDGYGLRIVESVPIQIEANEHNARYLKTKKDKLGHILDDNGAAS